MPAREPGPLRALGVALIVSFVCSLAVSGTAVVLGPRIRANRETERRAHLEALIDRQPGLREMLAGTSGAEVVEVVVDLETGDVVDWLDPATLPSDPQIGVVLPPERDLAGIGRVPPHGIAYVVFDAGALALVLLPVRGEGYGGTLHGYVSLGADANTVTGLSFYAHQETPGVGAMLLEDDDWIGEWTGKRVRDASGRVRIGVARGDAGSDASAADHEVDIVSGATFTSGGVGNLLRFWLGEDAYGPFLRRLAAGEVPR